MLTDKPTEKNTFMKAQDQMVDNIRMDPREIDVNMRNFIDLV